MLNININMSHSNKYLIQIYSDIKENTVFYNKNIYVINGEIHVLKGVSLTIENNTLIYIKNGKFSLLGLNPLALVPLTGLVTPFSAYTISWNSDIEAPILSTTLPSSAFSLKLSFYADAESWSLSRVDKNVL